MDNFSLQGILDPMPGLDPEFRYPVGYFPSDDRVTDPAALEKFSEVMRPFVIRFESGSVDVDPHVPVCVKHLLAELTGGGLKPGQRIVELAVSRELGVSTAVVREALLELQPLGAFVKKERRHWQVASVDDKQLEALREFREMVEVFALRRLFERPRCPLVAAALARNRRRTEEVLASRKSTIREILDVDLEFHRLLLEASGNPLLPERAGFIYLIIEFQLVSPHFRIERGWFGLRQHMRIHRAIEKGRPDLAESALRGHLQAADQSICAIARRMRRS
jgi:DNA-binding GntR family transcriptional regulator